MKPTKLYLDLQNRSPVARSVLDEIGDGRVDGLVSRPAGRRLSPASR